MLAGRIKATQVWDSHPDGPTWHLLDSPRTGAEAGPGVQVPPHLLGRGGGSKMLWVSWTNKRRRRNPAGRRSGTIWWASARWRSPRTGGWVFFFGGGGPWRPYVAGIRALAAGGSLSPQTTELKWDREDGSWLRNQGGGQRRPAPLLREKMMDLRRRHGRHIHRARLGPRSPGLAGACVRGELPVVAFRPKVSTFLRAAGKKRRGRGRRRRNPGGGPKDRAGVAAEDGLPLTDGRHTGLTPGRSQIVLAEFVGPAPSHPHAPHRQTRRNWSPPPPWPQFAGNRYALDLIAPASLPDRADRLRMARCGGAGLTCGPQGQNSWTCCWPPVTGRSGYGSTMAPHTKSAPSRASGLTPSVRQFLGRR